MPNLKSQDRRAAGGRRATDQNGPRTERRKPAEFTKAQAQSILQARLDATFTEQPRPPLEGYGAMTAGSKKTAKGKSHSFQAKAKGHSAPTKGWTFERRKKQIPRTTTIEDADFT